MVKSPAPRQGQDRGERLFDCLCLTTTDDKRFFAVVSFYLCVCVCVCDLVRVGGASTTVNGEETKRNSGSSSKILYCGNDG